MVSEAFLTLYKGGCGGRQPEKCKGQIFNQFLLMATLKYRPLAKLLFLSKDSLDRKIFPMFKSFDVFKRLRLLQSPKPYEDGGMSYACCLF